MVREKQEIKLLPYAKEYKGKHNGWAYHILDDNLQSFYPGFCCKDYLQDIVWSELTQKSMEVYGQKSDYKGIIDKQETLKLIVSPYMFDGVNEPIIENLEQLGINLQSFLNEIELLIGFELSLLETIDNKFLIIFSKEWIRKPYLLSLFTLLCRLGIYYDGELEEYIANPYKDNRPYLDKCDTYSLKDYFSKILDIINGKAEIEQKDWIDLVVPGEVHNSGLFSNISKIKYKDGNKSIEKKD